MKLIMENWREWLGGSTAAPEEETGNREVTIPQDHLLHRLTRGPPRFTRTVAATSKAAKRYLDGVLNSSWPQDRIDEIDSEEFKHNHNLFFEFVKNRFPTGEPARRGRTTAWLKKNKWNFPHDVDPNMNCQDKIFYLNSLAISFIKYPRPYNTIKKLPSISEDTSGIAPYQKCKLDVVAQIKKAVAKEKSYKGDIYNRYPTPDIQRWDW